jgi:hypothetical protein
MLLERDVVAFKKRRQLEEDVSTMHFSNRPPLRFYYQLSLYSILVEWYKCKAEKQLHKDLRIRWKDAGLKLASAMEQNKPIKEFQADIAKSLEAANKDAKAGQTAVQKIMADVDKLKKADRDLVCASHVRLSLTGISLDT